MVSWEERRSAVCKLAIKPPTIKRITERFRAIEQRLSSLRLFCRIELVVVIAKLFLRNREYIEFAEEFDRKSFVKIEYIAHLAVWSS